MYARGGSVHSNGVMHAVAVAAGVEGEGMMNWDPVKNDIFVLDIIIFHT